MTIRPRGLSQQGARSPTLGENDPRIRRAGQELGTSSWIKPPFFIDENGQLGIKLAGALGLTEDGQSITVRVADPLVVEHGSPQRIALAPQPARVSGPTIIPPALVYLGW